MSGTAQRSFRKTNECPPGTNVQPDTLTIAVCAFMEARPCVRTFSLRGCPFRNDARVPRSGAPRGILALPHRIPALRRAGGFRSNHLFLLFMRDKRDLPQPQ